MNAATDGPRRRRKKCNDTVAGGFKLVFMGGTLRVDPERLRAAAAAQTEVGTFVSGMATGQSITTAGTGMAGLLSEGACQFVGTAFDTAAGAVHEELTAHSTKLTAAADRYHQVDEETGRRLRKLAP
jgi:flagellar capping protein FliD